MNDNRPPRRQRNQSNQSPKKRSRSRSRSKKIKIKGKYHQHTDQQKQRKRQKQEINKTNETRMVIIFSNNNIHQISNLQSTSNYVKYLNYSLILYFTQNYNLLLLCTFTMFIFKHILLSFFNYFHLEKNSKNQLNHYYPMPNHINTPIIIFVNLINIYSLFFYILFTILNSLPINNTFFFFLFFLYCHIITAPHYYHYYLFIHLFNKDFVNNYIIHTITSHPPITSIFLFYYSFISNLHSTIMLILQPPTPTSTLSLPENDWTYPVVTT